MAIKEGTGHQPLRLTGLTALAAAFMAAGLAGCGNSGNSAYYANCVDPVTGQVVSQQWCNNNPGLYYYWMTSRIYNSGYYVPVSARTGPGWFHANNTTARTNAGLPKTGTVPHGFKVTSSSGGFDGHAGTSGGGEGGHGSGGSGHGSAGAGGHGSAGG